MNTKNDNHSLGIWMPHLQHQFRFSIRNTSKEISDQISRETVSVELDYHANTANVVVQQPLFAGALHHFLWQWLQEAAQACVVGLGGNGKPAYVIVLNKLHCVSHKCRFDYAESAVVSHEMCFTFQSLHMANPEEEKWATNSE